MSEKRAEFRVVARRSDIAELVPLITEVNGTKVGIYRLGDNFFAYSDTCSHQGGPCVEGEVRGDLRCRILPGGALQEYVSSEKVNIVCPWHGIEYALEDGVCRANKNLRLLSFELVLDGDDVKLKVS